MRREEEKRRRGEEEREKGEVGRLLTLRVDLLVLCCRAPCLFAGVLKTLLEAKCLPQILSGASAGSLMCSFIAVRTDQEVLRDLCVPEAERFFRACEEPFCVKLTRWLKKGYAFDKGHTNRIKARN